LRPPLEFRGCLARTFGPQGAPASSFELVADAGATPP